MRLTVERGDYVAPMYGRYVWADHTVRGVDVDRAMLSLLRYQTT